MIGGQLKDPRIGFVTVTRVEVGTDLRNARVYVGVLGSEADRERPSPGCARPRASCAAAWARSCGCGTRPS